MSHLGAALPIATSHPDRVGLFQLGVIDLGAGPEDRPAAEDVDGDVQQDRRPEGAGGEADTLGIVKFSVRLLFKSA